MIIFCKFYTAMLFKNQQKQLIIIISKSIFIENRTITSMDNHNQYNSHSSLNVKPTSLKDNMRKSLLSKISGYSSVLNGISPDQNLQILRISLKKELDRKQKLQKLIDKYQLITTQQKTHIKAIKSNIIELKDVESNFKTKFFLNPIIYVDNSLSKQTRQYLCMLLNTFYAKYEENSQCQFRTKTLGKQMNSLLQSISSNEENLLKIEKQTIGVQVQLEGELLSLKSKLRDQSQKQKQLDDENKRISTICSQYQNNYNQQLQKVQKLRQTCLKIESQISLLKQKVAQGEMVKKGKQEMMINEIVYQQRFQIQLSSVDEQIQKQQQKQKVLQNRIKQKKFKVQQLKSQLLKVNNFIETLQASQKQSENLKIEQVDGDKQDKLEIKHSSLRKIKKYCDVVDELNNTLTMVKSSLNFGNEVMSKDNVNYTVGMKVIEIKNENNKNVKSKISLR